MYGCSLNRSKFYNVVNLRKNTAIFFYCDIRSSAVTANEIWIALATVNRGVNERTGRGCLYCAEAVIILPILVNVMGCMTQQAMRVSQRIGVRTVQLE